MKKLYSFLSLLLLLTPFVGQAGCDNKVTVAVGGIGVRSKPGSTNGTTYEYCPTGTNTIIVAGSTSTSGAVLSWTGSVNGGVPFAITSTSTTNSSGTFSTIFVSPEVNTVYTLLSDINKVCNGANVISSQSITISPTLEVTANSYLVCSGAATTLTATGSSTSQYTWSGPGIATTTNSGTLVVNPTVTSTYTVTSTTASCGTTTQQITIEVKSVTIAPSAPNVCSGQSITLVASYNGTSVTSYKWENVTAGTTLPSTTSSQVVAPTITTTYKVTATTSDCATVTQRVTVTVGTAPTIAVSPTAATICSGTITTLTASSNNAGTTYSWADLAAPGTIVSTSPTYTTPALVTSKTYRLTTTSCSGASASSTTRDVVVTVSTPNYSVTPLTAAADVCSGSSLTLTASSNISGATYEWYIPAISATTVVAITPTLTVSPTVNTTYRAIITTSCGNSNTTTAPDVTVTVNPVPTASVTPTSTTKTRYAPVTLTAAGGGTYSWTATSNDNTTTLSATTASITVTPTYNTVYTVTVANASNCKKTAQSIVNISGPLPVELVSFEAVWVNKVASITWTTASEKNSAYFAAERSFDGSTFQTVGILAGAGTTSITTNYRFNDISLNTMAVPKVYYRLQQVDISGEVSYSPVRVLQVAAAGNAFQASVFPNPYTNTAAVQFHSLGDNVVNLTLHNVLGQIIFTKLVTAAAGVQEVALPLSATLPFGVYYLTIHQGNKQQVVRINH